MYKKPLLLLWAALSLSVLVGCTVTPKDAVGWALDAAGNAAGSVVDGAVDAAGNAVDGVADAAGNVVDGAVDAAGNAANGAIDAAGNAVDWIPGVDGVVDAAGKVVDGAVDAAGNAANGAVDAAGNAVNGAVDAAWSAVDGATNAAGNAAAAVAWSTDGSVADGSEVSVYYVWTLDDWTVFDTNVESVIKDQLSQISGWNVDVPADRIKPLTFTIGQGQMIPWFEKAVMWKKVGDKFTVTIPAAEAYGEKDPSAMQDLPAAVFSGVPVQVGQSYPLTDSQSGQVFNVKVVKTGENGSGSFVTVDFNHQLAGEALTFEIAVDSIK